MLSLILVKELAQGEWEAGLDVLSSEFLRRGGNRLVCFWESYLWEGCL